MIENKKQIRPDISSIQFKENISQEEKFQNEVLRPIIKMQHELIVSCFEHFLNQNKIEFDALRDTQIKDFIQKTFTSNNGLKKDLNGLIIGLFTLEEYLEYLNHISQINKRINSIIQTRIGSVYLK
jgi:hypothetical protein